MRTPEFYERKQEEAAKDAAANLLRNTDKRLFDIWAEIDSTERTITARAQQSTDPVRCHLQDATNKLGDAANAIHRARELLQDAMTAAAKDSAA